MFTVIVIGLGIAGSAACNHLTNFGIRTIALEGRPRIGGRIHTILLPDGTKAELGASFLHGQGSSLEGFNPLNQLLNKFGVKKAIEDFDDSNKYFFYHQEFKKTNNNLYFKYENESLSLLERIDLLGKELITDPNKNDFSISNALNKIGIPYSDFDNNSNNRKWPENLLIQMYEAGICAPLSQISLREIYNRKGFEGKDELIISGMETLVQGLINYSRQTGLLETYMEMPVININYTNKLETFVITKNNQVFKGDAIICTIPLGVLRRQNIIFTPTLPEWKQLSINNLSMGNLNRIIFHFKKCFWHNKAKYILLNDLNQFVRSLVPITGSPTLVIPHYLDNDHNSIENKIKLVISSLKKTFKNKFHEPQEVICTSWDQDPFSLGSHSFRPLGSSLKDTINLAQPLKNLYFAGEATNEYRALHGAYMSGIEAAEQVIEYKKEINY